MLLQYYFNRSSKDGRRHRQRRRSFQTRRHQLLRGAVVAVIVVVVVVEMTTECLLGTLVVDEPSFYFYCHAQKQQQQRPHSSSSSVSRRRHNIRPRLHPHPIIPAMEDLEDQARALSNANHPEYDPTALDDLLDDVMGHYNNDNDESTTTIIIDRFLPARLWMWRQWSGTAVKHCVGMAYSHLLTSALLCLLLRRIVYGDWKVWGLPPLPRPHSTIPTTTTTTTITTDPIHICNQAALQILDMVHTVWKNSLQPLTTIVLVFFVGHCYSFWMSCYNICRNTIQGSMHDILLLATSRANAAAAAASTTTTRHQRWRQRRRRHRNGATYTSDAEQFLLQLQHQLRAFHILFWASQTRRYRLLLTEPASSRMVAKGVLTQDEKETLDRLQLAVPKTHHHWIVLEWISASIGEATSIREQSMESSPQISSSRRPFGQLGGGIGHKRTAILQGIGLDHVLLEKILALRSGCQQLGSKLAARMPMPYAHLVRILVDTYLFVAPIAQYKELGIFAAVSTAVLSIFYLGLLELGFAMLDPFDDDAEVLQEDRDNEESLLYMDLTAMLRDSAAASQRWIAAGSSKLMTTTAKRK